MIHKAVIYTKDECPYCVKAKKLMEGFHIEYSEVKIGVDMSREEFVETFPDQGTVPLIFINEEKVGGYNEFRNWLDDWRRS